MKILIEWFIILFLIFRQFWKFFHNSYIIYTFKSKFKYHINIFFNFIFTRFNYIVNKKLLINIAEKRQFYEKNYRDNSKHFYEFYFNKIIK